MGIVLKQSFKNTLFIYLGFVFGGINTLVLYTRFLEDEYYGLVTYLLATSNILMPLIALGIHHTIVKFFSSYFTKADKDFSITYVGGFGPHRGLQTAIQAMPKVVQHIPNAKLFLIGKGSADVETKLRDIVKEFNVENSVVFVGYRPFKEVSTIMQKTNVNIIPHLANDHTDNTIPHKLFQIMMSRSLLLVSSCKPLKRIVTKYNAGIVFKADDANDFAEKVISIHQNYDEYQIKTQNAFDAVMNKGENWEQESLKLFSLYAN